MQVVKYNASGNDFVIFHTFIKKDYSKLAQKLCHRQEGIGADGLIVLLPNATVDFEWLFYNSDGSVALMCGNGSRACAHYAYTQGLAPASMSFLTGAGKITSLVQGDVVASQLTPPKELAKSFSQEGREWYFYDTGVPHLVTLVDDLSAFDKTLAAKMRYAHNANVNFVFFDKKCLHVRTYERGVEDETGACGTGMAASFYALYLLGLVGDHAKVYPTSKEELELSVRDGVLFLKGKVSKIFETQLERFV
ncbi:MAG: diaminopimelate epimerase [Sulfurospirillum sp.]|nr:diaminopimelate epimerase [Sulfurospirillum sp.]